MKRFLYLLACWALLTAQPGFCRVAPDSLAPAREYPVRGGLPNVQKKLAQGKPVTLAYLGGSITEAAGGWREQTVAWLQQQYPGAAVRGINASIGGTGSDLGVFRVGSHVLAHRPDLVFVEFAVNDNGKRRDQIGRAMEGIVRQIWQADPTTDICFVYTLTAAMAPVLTDGYLPESATAMEKIADHYAIPSVHLGLEVVRLAREGALIFQGKPEAFPGKIVFSGDNVHPYNQTGHRLYAETLGRAWPALAAGKAGRGRFQKKPVFADNWEAARMVAAGEARLSPGWTSLTPETDTVARRLANRFTYLTKASKPGEKLRIRFRGTVFGLYDVMGPGCGQYRVRVDGQEVKLQPRFDEYCTYYRANYFFLPTLPPGEHTVELEVAPELLDKAQILARRNNTIANPVPYAPADCYASQVLIIGQLLPTQD